MFLWQARLLGGNRYVFFCPSMKRYQMEDHFPDAANNWSCSYAQREENIATDRHRFRLGRLPSNSALASDFFVEPFVPVPFLAHHKTGWNVSFLDGSARFVQSVPNDPINASFAWSFDFAAQGVVWRYFDRR